MPTDGELVLWATAQVLDTGLGDEAGSEKQNLSVEKKDRHHKGRRELV